mmetsp:Transcript_60195/g.140230  ORF Transcript_60195/g.140230 Transcript_60195/m.140230 type:complete len:231 (-) Transcript_60195:35-727(-)
MGDAAGAEQALQRMHVEGVEVGRAAYDPLIRCWSAGHAEPEALQRAEAWLWKALEVGIHPTDAALTALLAALVRAGDKEGAERIVGVMRSLQRWPRSPACAVLARPHAAAGDFAAVEGLLDDLRCAGGKPDAACLRELLAAYARAPFAPKDGRIEACFRELLCTLNVRVAEVDGEVLGDLRRAVGYQRYTDLMGHGAHSIPLVRRQSHARNRVVGQCVAVEPCGSVHRAA